MPRITNARRAAAPPQLSWERREYRSPRGDWTWVLHDPVEWRMGADGWSASLLHAGRDVTSEHPALPADKAYYCTAELRPWAPDNHTLALTTWAPDQPAQLYDVDARTIVAIEGNQLPYSAQWAYDSDRLLITAADGGRLYDHTGQLCGHAPWQALRYPYLAHWLRGGLFFVISKDAHGNHITFFSGDDGAMIGRERLDPADLLPFERERFADLPRDRWSLRISESTRAVGELLDRWERTSFDPVTGTLLLNVYRPIGDPHDEDGELVCDAVEQWVAVDIVSTR